MWHATETEKEKEKDADHVEGRNNKWRHDPMRVHEDVERDRQNRTIIQHTNVHRSPQLQHPQLHPAQPRAQSPPPSDANTTTRTTTPTTTTITTLPTVTMTHEQLIAQHRATMRSHALHAQYVAAHDSQQALCSVLNAAHAEQHAQMSHAHYHDMLVFFSFVSSTQASFDQRWAERTRAFNEHVRATIRATEERHVREQHAFAERLREQAVVKHASFSPALLELRAKEERLRDSGRFLDADDAKNEADSLERVERRAILEQRRIEMERKALRLQKRHEAELARVREKMERERRLEASAKADEWHCVRRRLKRAEDEMRSMHLKELMKQEHAYQQYEGMALRVTPPHRPSSFLSFTNSVLASPSDSSSLHTNGVQTARPVSRNERYRVRVHSEDANGGGRSRGVGGGGGGDGDSTAPSLTHPRVSSATAPTPPKISMPTKPTATTTTTMATSPSPSSRLISERTAQRISPRIASIIASYEKAASGAPTSKRPSAVAAPRRSVQLVDTPPSSSTSRPLLSPHPPPPPSARISAHSSRSSMSSASAASASSAYDSPSLPPSDRLDPQQRFVSEIAQSLHSASARA